MRAYHAAFLIMLCLVSGIAAALKLDGYTINILIEVVTYVLAVAGLSIGLGLCGQVNFGQAAIFAIGAYIVALGTADYDLPFWLCLAGSAVATLALGAALGMSTVRFSGPYLSMATMSFQLVTTLVLTNAADFTHGPDGVASIHRPPLFESSQAYLALCIFISGLVLYLTVLLPGSRLGRAMRAVRDDQIAANAMGVDVVKVKVVGFALSSLLAGIGGGLFAAGVTYISPDQFGFPESISFLAMVLVGGISSAVGSAIGTTLLIVLPECLRILKAVPGLYLAFYGLAVIVIVAYLPEGIWGWIERRYAAYRLRHKRADRPAAPSEAIGELTFTPRADPQDDMLEIRRLSRHFGGLKAIDDISFRVQRGGVHALVGPNGSGKTTTMNVTSGVDTPTSGSVFLNGVEITRARAFERCRSGLSRTFQNIRLFRSMTALENVMVGAQAGRNAVLGEAASAASVELRARRALAFVGLTARAGEQVASFSYGHQRLVEIARALATNPLLVLLDEPAAGLNSTEKLALHDLLEKIASYGLTVLIIDHDMNLVRQAARHLTVLNFGRRIADGRPSDVLDQPEVVAAYLGTSR